MIKLICTILSFTVAVSTVYAQKGINFNHFYLAGGRLNMNIDSAAKNVYYATVFPNQPNTSFNFLPEVENVAVQNYFRKQDRVENYRYTILVDNKPIVVNQSIKQEQLKDVIRKDNDFKDELLTSANLGTFKIKDKSITIIHYDIERPLAAQKAVFYGRPIPKAKIKALAKRFKTDLGVDYDHIFDPKDRTDLTFREKDDELTIKKDWSEIDYVYSISIRDKQQDKIIFESTAWEYGGTIDVIDGYEVFLPYVRIDKSIFKKSGDYEIIIQPSIDWKNCLDCNMTPTEIERYTTRHTLAITLDQEIYSQKELLTYTFLVILIFGIIFLLVLTIIKRRNRKVLEEKEQQKNTVKLQLSSIRSQLNPHFLFNALAGIQNLMNKNEIDHANQYLAKFARLTRNVLNDRERITLAQEKALLDDYLQMEQLRFGFQYDIKLGDDVDLANIEIPSMLLQPFVENAVKHGMAQKGAEGMITIEFVRRANDLLFTVTDNGHGFDTQQKSDGLGLLLSQRRVALLNSIYKENQVILDIRSTTSGTVVSMTLTDWL
ncbi:sensor histidine kinase [Sphingobacterium corticibacter]|uniref:Sensor histidine kinase n=1 Tax=Sphingobacterium corticibacter TaxID=2171749 RepID=A0A2T8HGI3_9SPHI|nr:histidine kinase [Sphingobacterium corticibacter]PVH24546.1 sensor histidine kinase [Sphingobacterium corticibacter]